MAPTRRMSRKLILALVGTLLLLVLIELGLRILSIRPERSLPPRWLTIDGTSERELGVWGEGRNKRPSPYANEGVTMGEYVPGARFKIVYGSNPRGVFAADNSVTVTINQQGLRGPEVTVAKPPGTFRVLGLGDSFAFGLGVREEDTFLRRLEADLNQTAPPG